MTTPAAAAVTTKTAAELIAYFIPPAAREPLDLARQILTRYDQLDEAVKRVETEARAARAGLPAARERLAAIELDLDVKQALQASGIAAGDDLKGMVAARTRLSVELRDLEEKSQRAGRVRDGVTLRRIDIIDELNAAAPGTRAVLASLRSNFIGYVTQLLTAAIAGDGSLVSAASTAAMGHHSIAAPDHMFLRHLCIPDPRMPVVDLGDGFGPSAIWLLNARGGKVTVAGRAVDWREDPILAQLSVEFRAVRATADAVERVLRDAERRLDQAAGQAERARLAAAMDAGQRVVLPQFSDLPQHPRLAAARPVQRAIAWAGAAQFEDTADGLV